MSETAQNTAQRYILGLTENRTVILPKTSGPPSQEIRIVPRDDIGFKAAGVEESMKEAILRLVVL